jgi:hypothetical protein
MPITDYIYIYMSPNTYIYMYIYVCHLIYIYIYIMYIMYITFIQCPCRREPWLGADSQPICKKMCACTYIWIYCVSVFACALKQSSNLWLSNSKSSRGCTHLFFFLSRNKPILDRIEAHPAHMSVYVQLTVANYPLADIESRHQLAFDHVQDVVLDDAVLGHIRNGKRLERPLGAALFMSKCVWVVFLPHWHI